MPANKKTKAKLKKASERSKKVAAKKIERKIEPVDKKSTNKKPKGVTEKVKKIEKATEEVEQTEEISKKKVIYAEIDEEVTVVFDKVKSVGVKHVYIVVPKRAILFQSGVNLRILKRKAEDVKKKIYFITNDKNGIHLAQQVGIEVYNKANDEGKPALFSAESEDDKMRITPLRATVNEITEEAPTRLTEKKLSISELLKKSGGKKTVDISKINDQTQKPKKAKPKFVVIGPSRRTLIGLSAVSLIILFVIIYIALPGATVYLTPAASVLEKSVNITLADFARNKSELETKPPHMIASYSINTTHTETITHFATGKKFSDRGANSSGKITIINTTSNNWPLIPQTRFQTEEGVVFRITEGVTVPAANSNGFGTLETFVVADITDAFGGIVGERGNVDASSFYLPGLKEDSRSELYAESYEPMTGGVTDFITFISPEDLSAAESRIKDELIKGAVEELRGAVNKKTELVEGTTVYTLLEGDGAVKTGEVQFEIPSELEGTELTEFTVTGNVDISGVYYEHDQMLEILKNELLVKKSPRKELLRINEDSTSYRIFEWDEYSGKIKLTANIKGIEQFSIDPDKESGQKLLQKIRDHIAGKDIEDAKSFIQNLPEVNKVEIDSWPAWAPTVPNIPDNIEFEIRDAVSVGE
jgi:hypothetical protein